LPGLHLHDLRHTGNTMVAATGASLRELMERMGHTSTRAALIYQHATSERDEAIAAAMGEVLASVRRKGPHGSPLHRARMGTKEGDGFLMAAQCIFDIWLELGVSCWSGRRESNPHDQLGRVTAHPGHGL
jgi:hypothetical protein